MSALRWVVVAVLLSAGPGAFAAADGPDRWDVTGVAANDVLKMHAAPSTRSRVLAGIPSDAKGLTNRGCRLPSLRAWQAMSPAEQKRAARSRWCRVSYGGTTGWVAGRYLSEGSDTQAGATREGPAGRRPLNGSQVGLWTLLCLRGACWIEQLTTRAPKATLLKIEPVAAGNARITIERLGLPRQGVLSIVMDGKKLSAGPVAPLLDKDGRRLVMEPDDMTLGLLRSVSGARTMVLSFEGEAAAAELDVSETSKALQELAQLRGR